jgi:hypothetical protein
MLAPPNGNTNFLPSNLLFSAIILLGSLALGCCLDLIYHTNLKCGEKRNESSISRRNPSAWYMCRRPSRLHIFRNLQCHRRIRPCWPQFEMKELQFQHDGMTGDGNPCQLQWFLHLTQSATSRVGGTTIRCKPERNRQYNTGDRSNARYKRSYTKNPPTLLANVMYISRFPPVVKMPNLISKCLTWSVLLLVVTCLLWD